MSTTMHLPEMFDNLAAELSDRAFDVASRHGMRGNSVELELQMWDAMRRELRQARDCGSVAKGDSAKGRSDTCAAALADRAYQVALAQGFDGDFIDLELDLWSNLRNPTRGLPPVSSSQMVH